VARKPRDLVADGIYHVFARGNGRDLIYRDDVDRRIYLRLLKKVVDTTNMRCLAYCLMTNHVHLLVQTPDANLDTAMHRLHSRYASGFNQRHRTCGHVFQGRYGAVRVTSDGQLLAVLTYIARNPVEAALCDAPIDWPWSSFSCVVRATASRAVDVDRLLAHLDDDSTRALRRYVDLCNLKGA
jgi:REP element-mobilizing transposase RayT